MSALREPAEQWSGLDGDCLDSNRLLSIDGWSPKKKQNYGETWNVFPSPVTPKAILDTTPLRESCFSPRIYSRITSVIKNSHRGG